MTVDYAFIIIHFGNAIKYLELEIYLSLMLRKNSKYDIVYMYSITDTPILYPKIMNKYCNFVIPYDDNNITFNIKNFNSYYEHFNTLRTCNFLFAYKLIQYKKICIIESDTIILKNIDDIFNLKTPSILLANKTIEAKKKIKDNYKTILDIKKILLNCSTESDVNGGVIVVKPSITKYNFFIKNVKIVIENNCRYPNEVLFSIANKFIYNLPYKYNGTTYDIARNSSLLKINMNQYLSIVHFSSDKYKTIDYIRDNWVEKLKEKKKDVYNFVKLFKKLYFDKYDKIISKELINQHLQ